MSCAPHQRKPLRRQSKRGAKKAVLRGALKTRVLARDRGCVLCRKLDGWLDAHHIEPKGRGGPDEVSNLVTLCRSCHEEVHRAPREWRPKLYEYLRAVSLLRRVIEENETGGGTTP